LTAAGSAGFSAIRQFMVESLDDLGSANVDILAVLFGNASFTVR
jgi:hypothetical protein